MNSNNNTIKKFCKNNITSHMLIIANIFTLKTYLSDIFFINFYRFNFYTSLNVKNTISLQTYYSKIFSIKNVLEQVVLQK